MSVKSWITSWSWRRSSPFLKITGYEDPSSHRRCSRSGNRFDLKTDDLSGSIPTIERRASSGSGIGAKFPSAERESFKTARSLSIFFRRASFELRRSFASAEMRAMKSAWRRRSSRRFGSS